MREQLVGFLGRFTLRAQLVGLAFSAIFLTVAFTQWQNHKIAYAEIIRQTKAALQPTPFEEARQVRRKSLAHIARIISTDSDLVKNLRTARAKSLREYAAQVPQLKDSPTGTKLAELTELRTRELGSAWDGSQRLFLNIDAGSESDVPHVAAVNACADLMLICDAQGVVLLELRTEDESTQNPKHLGRVLVDYPLDPSKLGLPRRLQLKQEPLIAEMVKDENEGISLHNFFHYGDGYIYDGVARRIVLRKKDDDRLVLILADRVDSRMMKLAGELIQVKNILALVPDRSGLATQTKIATLDEDLRKVAELPQKLAKHYQLNKPPDLEPFGRTGYFVSDYPLSSSPRALRLDLNDTVVDKAAGDTAARTPDVGRVVFLKSEDSLDAILSQQDWSAFRVAVAALSFGLLFASVMAGIVSKPLVDLANSMRQVGQGQLEVQAHVGGPSEIRHAAAAFNNMVDGLRQKETLEKFVTRLEEIRKSADVSDPLVRDQTQFGRYVVARRLGGGGMATVYVGLPVETLSESERVAIKVIHREFAVSEDYQARFRREFNVMKSLTHPGLVQVFESGELNGLLYIVMEYVDGTTLGDSLEKNGPVSLDRFHQLVLPLLDAMQFSHTRGVVHRDLKPDNLMLTTLGLKVMDFGLAVGSDMSRITQSGDAIGTPRYMPPEQINGQECDGRSDQYSLGCIFYEMLTGRCPFVGADVVSLVFQHLSQDPLPMSKYRDGIPTELNEIVLKMLKKEPKNRFQSLAEVKEALQAVLGTTGRTG